MSPDGNGDGNVVLTLTPGQWMLLEQSAPSPWPQTCAQLNAASADWLKTLNLLELNDDGFHWWQDTPFDKQAMTSGATRIAKIAVPLVGGTSVAGAIATFIKGWGGSGAAEWVLLGCAAFLLAAAAVGVALIVRADLCARATSTAAQYQARAQAAAAYLSACRPTARIPTGRPPSQGG